MSTPAKRHSDPERAESRRKQVLEAAAVCFGQSGFHGASMAEISKQAGMSAGHIYNYFDNKDAIIMAFVALRVEHVTSVIGELDRQDDPLRAMLEGAARTVEEHLDPPFWKLPMEIFAEASRNPKIAAALQAADAGSLRQFRAVVRRGRALHGLAVDEDTLDGRIEATIALFHGLSLRALHHPGLNRTALVDGLRVALDALLMH